MNQSIDTGRSSAVDQKSSQRLGLARGTSPLWNRALKRYREELEDMDDAEVLTGVQSLEDLIAYARTIEPIGSNSFQILSRLGPMLKFVDDFSAILAICLGANAKITALVWGSLRMIINLTSSADDALQKVLDMLEELSLSLPRFRYYEENLPMDRAFESALVDLYSEILCFYARIIKYYKANPHSAMQHAGWVNFQKDFTSTVRRVKHMSGVAEMQADLARMRVDRGKYDEVLDMLKDLNDRKARGSAIEHFHHIPVSSTGRFKGRENDLPIIQKALTPDCTRTQLQSFALYGMGGVGKTQLALRFALDSRKNFDVILWIAAETSMSIDQSFRDAAIGLGLNQENVDGDNESSGTAYVKNWLSDPWNNRSWLVIFDNADDLGLLRHVWPANGTGSVLLTSRDTAAASTVATDGLNLQPFDQSTGADIFLQLLGITCPNNEERHEASKITQILGGLPLALDQMAGFIKHRRMRLQDFLPMYQRNTARIHARQHEFSDYSHTLATVFNVALSSLTGSARHLQNLVGFLEPDAIPETLFLDGAHLISDQDFEFLTDELDFGDAQEPLLQTALINKDANERLLSVHRLVQSAVLQQLDEQGRRKYFSVASTLLSLGFPDTWSKDIGHQKTEWARCERYLPHVNALVRLASTYESLVDQPDAWAELLLRCSWYLYEKEQYGYAAEFVRVALKSFTNHATLAYANAIDLLGLIHLDMAQFDEARASFEIGLSTRQGLLLPNDPLIAFALNNLALVYTEVPDLVKAEQYHKQAIDIRLHNKSDRIGNSYSNYAVTLLQMGKPDEAESILLQCPGLQDCTDQAFLESDNPRIVGDMVVLSRIRKAQDRVDEAMRLASKALVWRQNVHGERFKTCDSMYDVACLLHGQGQTATCMELLNNVSKIAATLEAGENHQARAEWKASQILRDMHQEKESAIHEMNAKSLRMVCRPGEDKETAKDDESWERLTPYMLW